MGASLLAFYASEEEQQEWLAGLLREADHWCVMRRLPLGYAELSIEDVLQLSLYTDRDYELALFLGNRSISTDPVWRSTPDGRIELDFVRSKSVEFTPCLTAGEILLQGRLAILRRSQYIDAAVDPNPVRAWYGVLARSLSAALQAPGAILVQQTTAGDVKQWKDVVVSRGALAHARAGGALKQFVAGAVSFNVEHAGRRYGASS